MKSLDNHNLPNKEKVKLNLGSAFWELMVSSSLSFILCLHTNRKMYIIYIYIYYLGWLFILNKEFFEKQLGLS